MKEIKLNGLYETIYYDRCPNGLDIYVWVNKKVNAFKGTITFLVGSDDVEFRTGKQKFQVPYGSAHYLEHILCKTAEGTSVLGEFQKYGSYCNAATFPYKTIFEFVGTEHLIENINLLLETTQQKEFIAEYFESERGPIIEETRMSQDRTGRVIGVEINRSLYSKYPNRVFGTGSIQDVEEITLNDLQCIYEHFYHPENSFVTITGNVDPLAVIHHIKENQKHKEFPSFKKPVLQNYHEPKKIVTPYKEIETNVSVPQIYLSVKIPVSSFEGYDIVTVIDALQLVLFSNFGVTSLLRDELIQKKIVIDLGATANLERDYFILQIYAKTKYPDETLNILQNKIHHLEFNKKDIDRKKKSEIANLVLAYEDPEEVNDMISYQIAKFGRLIVNEKEVLEKLTFSKIKTIFTKFTMKEIAIVVALPKKIVKIDK